MKKLPLLVLLLSFFSLTQMASASDSTGCTAHQIAQSPFAGGTGSAENPFGICTPDQLKRMSLSPQAHFELWSDIDLEAAPWQPIFSNAVPFKGSLDGKGHTISSMGIFNNQDSQAGMIRVCVRCSIQNLNIAHSTVIGKVATGTLIGLYIAEYDAKAINSKPLMQNISITDGLVLGENLTGGVFGTVRYAPALLSDKDFSERQVSFEGSLNFDSLPMEGAAWISGGYSAQ